MSNTNTYPNEPANPNDYVGFNKSVYYILNLLREMFFSKTESENKFFPKTGGVVGGNLTIQGNLVVNGNSYKIDTQALDVKNYTITLAKDNTQTLTSMVGMVVPKYNGTDYGFFGWDASGYAYVGDLTNYDGSSAITLANNSSLQRIATIDASSLTTTANGKVMIWDEASYTFKVAPNGTYVIKNGRLVQGYDKDDIDDALANLQPFDTLTDSEIEDATEVIPPTTGLVNPIVDLIYPIGSIYISVNSTNPSTLFGGTWEQLKDRFLLGAGSSYTAGATGGEATHTLTANEMPSHNHDLRLMSAGGSDEGAGWVPQPSKDFQSIIYNGSNHSFAGTGGMTDRQGGTVSTKTFILDKGGSQAHNNMPPYLVVYMWKRTA